jgi:hypothetical protein
MSFGHRSFGRRSLGRRSLGRRSFSEVGELKHKEHHERMPRFRAKSRLPLRDDRIVDGRIEPLALDGLSGKKEALR